MVAAEPPTLGPQRQRILICSRGFPPDTGGIETYTLEIARAYRRAGWRPVVLTQCPARRGVWRRDGFVVVNVGPGSYARIALAFARAAAGLLRRGRFAAVHATSWKPALSLIPLCWSLPLVITIHGTEVFLPPRPLHPLMRWAFARADVVPVISRYVQRLVTPDHLPVQDRWVLAWNGCSPWVERPQLPLRLSPQGVTSLVTVGRLIGRKNIQGVIAAMGLLARRGGAPPIELVVVGEGPLRPELEALAAREGVAGRVIFLGRSDDATMARVLRGADAFVLPQIRTDDTRELEGFGLVVADAMAAGLPVVVGRDGGPVDIVEDGVTGLVVDGYDPAAIALAIAALAADPALRERLGLAARRWARANLSWDAHVQAILERLPAAAALPAQRGAAYRLAEPVGV
jgi:glycosyltransferase involved in cell wall biosynthesis